jgi:hypothetical protein
MAFNSNSVAVYNYVKENESKNITAQDIASALGLNSRQVNGIITAAFQRHKNEEKEIVPLMVRVDGEIENADGTHKAVKFIQLTEEGKNIEVTEKD